VPRHFSSQRKICPLWRRQTPTAIFPQVYLRLLCPDSSGECHFDTSQMTETVCWQYDKSEIVTLKLTWVKIRYTVKNLWASKKKWAMNKKNRYWWKTSCEEKPSLGSYDDVRKIIIRDKKITVLVFILGIRNLKAISDLIWNCLHRLRLQYSKSPHVMRIHLQNNLPEKLLPSCICVWSVWTAKSFPTNLHLILHFSVFWQ